MGGKRQLFWGDAENIRIESPVDVIVSLETIEHLQNPERQLGGVVQNLAQDGFYIVSIPSRKAGTLADRPRNPCHMGEGHMDEFRTLLARYFRAVEIYW